jgi:UDP-N-acetylmuramoyl-tripeptide--D-alanyl-D-alanine ligase
MNIQSIYHIFKNECKRVSTDSRNIQQGDLFFALKGTNFNGNEYAAEALSKGATYVVIDEEKYKGEGNFILVENALTALQQLARYHRDQFDIPFIAIAGSNGKTTTKELIKEVLKSSFITYATPGNFNNEIGTPLTLLQINNDAEAAVIEMGARQLGDIAELCKIANPNYGLITNTGKDHLETFLTLENTLKTNAELFEHLKINNGTALVSSLQADLLQVSDGVKHRITYGFENAEITGNIKQLFPYLTITFQHNNIVYEIETKLVGKYNFENIMAAVAIGLHLNIHPSLIKKAIESYVPSNNRSQILQQGSNTFIMDAYNANPSSMGEALNNLDLIESNNKIAILGDMLELGEASYEEHLLMALKLKNMHLKQVILVGEEFAKVADKLDCLHFNNTELLRQWYLQQQFENAVVLLKGSRKIALERMLL